MVAQQDYMHLYVLRQYWIYKLIMLVVAQYVKMFVVIIYIPMVFSVYATIHYS
jgi:hypothetical protein